MDGHGSALWTRPRLFPIKQLWYRAECGLLGHRPRQSMTSRPVGTKTAPFRLFTVHGVWQFLYKIYQQILIYRTIHYGETARGADVPYGTRAMVRRYGRNRVYRTGPMAVPPRGSRPKRAALEYAG